MAVLAGHLALGGILSALFLALAWDTAGPEIILAVAAGGILMATGVGAIRTHGAARRLSASSARPVPLPPGAAPLLAGLRLRSLEGRIGPRVATHRCYRRGCAPARLYFRA